MVLAEASAVIDFDRARHDSDERALVAEAKAGSEVAFEKLYRMHVGRVHGLCLRMTANRERAEDCTQEAFIQAWRALPRFEGRSGFGPGCTGSPSTPCSRRTSPSRGNGRRRARR